MTLSFTGERFLPDCQGEMVYEHWHRYLIAADHVHGKRVLDLPAARATVRIVYQISRQAWSV